MFHEETGEWLPKAQSKRGAEEYDLQYGIAPIQQCKRFTAYGVERRSIPRDMLQNPTVCTQSGKEGVMIPTGIPLGLMMQKCQGVPTHIWDSKVHNGKEDRENPEICRMELQPQMRMEAIPTR